MKKFVLRNRRGVFAACVIAASLIAGIVGTTSMAVVARNQRARAELARREAEKARLNEAEQRARAEMEAAKAMAVRRFLEKDLLSSVSPSSGLGATVTVREVLDKSKPHLDRAFEGQPELNVSIKATIGRMYRALGLYEQAQQVLEPAFEYATRVLGKEHIETLNAARHLIEARMFQMQFSTVLDDSKWLLEVRRRSLGADHLDTLDAMELRAGALIFTQQWDEAESLLRQALEARLRVQGSDHPDVFGAKGNLGILYQMSGRQPAEAQQLLHEAVDGYSHQYGPDHPEALAFAGALGTTLLQYGRIADARETLAKTVEGYSRAFGRDHGSRASLLFFLGVCLVHDNELEQAKNFIDEAYIISSKTNGRNHESTIAMKLAQIRILLKSGKPKKAEKVLKRMLDAPRPIIREKSGNYWQALHLLADIHHQLGKDESAVEEARRALALMQELGTQGRQSADSVEITCGRALVGLRRFEEAEKLFLHALSEHRKTTAEDGIFVQNTLAVIVEFYQKWGKPEMARTYSAMITTSHPANSPRPTDATSAPTSQPAQ